IEEEKVRRELEQEKKKIEKDQTQFTNEINKLMKYLQKTSNDTEKQLYIDKVKELEEKLKELEKAKQTVLERGANAKAGFVYIISNIGSFGEDVYKIGMTRRLEPMDRVKELSSASVPFEFDVHAMIFSDDAPALENRLHQHFKNQSINKVNPRKEFFHVTLDEIEQVVKENFNSTVEFTRIPIAKEYRQSLLLSEQPQNIL
ncbi:GIY-YIG nuclease family protein, partial [Clostridium butyricum]